VRPLSDKQIRASLINATRRETTQATLPDLAGVSWDQIDYLGWRDRKAPLAAYVVLELAGEPTGILLRAGTASATTVRRKALCSWCRDLASVEAAMYVARRGGSAGRAGNTIGTLVCEDFSCSRNVRRPPTSSDAGTDAELARELIVRERVAGLRERSARFVREVAATL
jgi:hypothetical protein